MEFLVSANTDIGLVKDTNQDGMTVKVFDTCQGKMAFAVLCDGMGGLAKGEVASTTVICAFNDWAYTVLPELCKAPIQDYEIRSQWERIVVKQNELIKAYGAGQGINLGTTIVVMLVTETRYYLAESCDVSPDGLTYTVKLRDNLNVGVLNVNAQIREIIKLMKICFYLRLF